MYSICREIMYRMRIVFVFLYQSLKSIKFIWWLIEIKTENLFLLGETENRHPSKGQVSVLSLHVRNRTTIDLFMQKNTKRWISGLNGANSTWWILFDAWLHAHATPGKRSKTRLEIDFWSNRTIVSLMTHVGQHLHLSFSKWVNDQIEVLQ